MFSIAPPPPALPFLRKRYVADDTEAEASTPVAKPHDAATATSANASPQHKQQPTPMQPQQQPAAPKQEQTQLAATARIAALEFAVMSTHDIEHLSHLQVVNRNFYAPPQNRDPLMYGVLDRSLGISDKKNMCTTCGKGLAECIGHFGHMELVLPCFHIGYIKEVQHILQCVCKQCGHILLDSTLQSRYTKLMNNPTIDRRTKQHIFHDDILNRCKKQRFCPSCNAYNGTIKKIAGVFKYIHEYKHTDGKVAKLKFLQQFKDAMKINTEIEQHISKLTHDTDPLYVYHLFQRIPDHHIALLNCSTNRPEHLLLTSLLVPPVCIRPSVSMGTSGSNEDDLTVKLGDILQINNFLRDALAKGAQTATIVDNWDFLQSQIAMYINSDLPGFPAEIAGAGRQIRALTQRLKGKQGRFRGNLSGKRVDFSSRTVISPDPNLRIDEVGVPELVAKTLTYPERVNKHNIQRLKRCVTNGPQKHPGANIVEYVNGVKINLRYGDRRRIAESLSIGDLVERHLANGDVVLFNRQPSLHRISIMAHRVRVLQWRTFRFNECVCAPYNADFDGDEMNLHVPQTEEARAEALTLMSTVNNQVTPRHGEPLIHATQDFLTTSFLITSKDVLYDKSQFMQICTMFNDAAEYLNIPVPCILKPVALWSGKQIMSMLLKPNASSEWPTVTLSTKNKSYTGREEIMCPRDGWCVIRNSEVLCGSWDKSILGGDKNGLHYSLIRDFSPQVAARVLNRLAKLSARWITNRGFSIGIDDVTPSESLLAAKSQKLTAGYAKCDTNIDLYDRGKLPPASGCSEEETLEALSLGELSAIREELGSYCLSELDFLHNAPLIMAVCGSKGSKINISQMVACVGQQAVSGKRVPNGFIHRSLPHYPIYSRTPDAKGFVKNSFYSGLTASEFFFHTQGGREGLVDTAVKTAETGYMQRRLVKALEDLCTHYDGSVRTSTQNIVQFIYGDDGLDPIMMAQDGLPVAYKGLLLQCTATPSKSRKPERAMTPQQLIKATAILDTPYYAGACSQVFLQQTKNFVVTAANALEDSLQTLQQQQQQQPAVKSEHAVASKKPKKSPATAAQTQQLLYSTFRIYPSQLHLFFERCRAKFLRAKIEAGTAVGAIAAQSIGEPGTQMTLKTFHFAGVASMNVTLGVPRIKEIINASKTISSPIMTVPLELDSDIKVARIVKGRIEKTRLGEIAAAIDEVYTPEECFIVVKLDTVAIDALQLAINADTVVERIKAHKKLKLGSKTSASSVRAKGDDMIVISYQPASSALEGDHDDTMLVLQRIKGELQDVQVSGVSTANRAVINDQGNGTYNLLVEGYGLTQVLSTVGVKGNLCTSNHILEMEKVLGIEAARATIIREIHTTMDGHGLTVDPRHVALLGDIMSYRGEILGITRFGIAKMKESVLMLASFEKTADHLFEAAMRGAKDEISGVSECIIMGQSIPLGTGLFDVMQSYEHHYDEGIKAIQSQHSAVDAHSASSLLLHNKEFAMQYAY